jgi:hypothetical protein
VKELREPESAVSGSLRAVLFWMFSAGDRFRALARGRGRRDRGPASG